MSTWSRDDVLQFIEIYRGLECIWKVKSKDYTKRDKREAAYKEMLKFVRKIDPSATRDSIVKKINNLRSCFRKELKKVNRSQNSGTGRSYVPKLWYYNELTFLIEQDQDEDEDETSNQEGSDQITRIFVDTDQTEPPIYLEDEESESDSNISRPPKRKLRSSSTVDDITHSQQETNKRPAKEETLLSNLVQELQTIARHSHNTSSVNYGQVDKKDFYDHFGSYVSSMLRAIGPPTAMRLQERITSMLTNALCPPDTQNEQLTSTESNQKQCPQSAPRPSTSTDYFY